MRLWRLVLSLAVLAALAWAVSRRTAPTLAVPAPPPAPAAAPAVAPAPAPASAIRRRPSPSPAPAEPAAPSPRAPGLRDKGEALFGTSDRR